MKAINNDRSTPRNRKSCGFALLMVLMLIATAAVVGVSYIYGAQVKTASTGNLMLACQARYLAESGLQHGLYSLQTRATDFGSEAAPNGPYHIEDDDGGYVFWISATSDASEYQITATGTEGGISQTVAMTVSLKSNYAAAMGDLEPTYWWRLGDSDLTAIDEQGLKHGAYVNGASRGAEGAILGDADTAADFHGSTDHINLGTIEDLSDDRLTLGCWARADAWSDAWPRLLARGGSQHGTDRRWQVSLTNDRKLRFVLRLKNSSNVCTGQTSIGLGEWFFVVATFNKDTRQMWIYLNGELDGTKNSTTSADINDDESLEAWIGDQPVVAGQAPWNGPIDEAFIVKGEALTSDQVKALFEASIPEVKVVSWDD